MGQCQGLIGIQNPPAAPIFDVDGNTLLSGPGFLAQVYAGAFADSLEPIGSPVPFSTVRPGYFFDPTGAKAMPGTSPGGNAMVQVVAWRTSDGATFGAADHPGAHLGQSTVFEVRGRGDPNPPGEPPAPILYGLQSFSLHVVVPEPSVLELVLVGAALLMLGRGRRHQAR